MPEIIGSGQVTPARLYAFTRLVARQSDTLEQLYDLLQPKVISDSQDAAKAVFNDAKRLGLVQLDEGGQQVVIRLHDDVRPALTHWDNFRRFLASRLTRVVERGADNYLLNEFTAWYAVQGSAVLGLSQSTRLAVAYNDERNPDDQRSLNETKIAAWRTWAAFLGWGVLHKIGSSQILLPDATVRVRDLLQHLFNEGTVHLNIDQFLHRLNEVAPELDDGMLYQSCWESKSNGTQPPHLSLMLSTALRNLHDTGLIRLEQQADALAVRVLHPATGSPFKRISHILFTPDGGAQA